MATLSLVPAVLTNIFFLLSATEPQVTPHLSPSVIPGPKMVAVQNYHGNPAPPGKPVLTFQTGEVIELLRGDPESQWWEVSRLLLCIRDVWLLRVGAGL